MIELVWDRGQSGTCSSSRGAMLTIDETETWSPTDLLGAAAASCLMRSFLRVAAAEGLMILGYVASARISETRDGVFSIEIQPCVVVEQHEDIARVQELCNQAKDLSPVAKVLGHRLSVRPFVRTVAAEGGET